MKNIAEIGVKCVDCYQCLDICKIKAIKATYDKEGFFYPEINKSICVMECA